MSGPEERVFAFPAPGEARFSGMWRLADGVSASVKVVEERFSGSEE